MVFTEVELKVLSTQNRGWRLLWYCWFHVLVLGYIQPCVGVICIIKYSCPGGVCRVLHVCSRVYTCVTWQVPLFAPPELRMWIVDEPELSGGVSFNKRKCRLIEVKLVVRKGYHFYQQVRHSRNTRFIYWFFESSPSINAFIAFKWSVSRGRRKK